MRERAGQMRLPSSEEWRERCASDGEFMLAARHWDGGVQLKIGDEILGMAVLDGQPSAGPAEGPGTIAFTGDTMTWQNVLTAVPERFNNDLMANISQAQGLAPAPALRRAQALAPPWSSVCRSWPVPCRPGRRVRVTRRSRSDRSCSPTASRPIRTRSGRSWRRRGRRWCG